MAIKIILFKDGSDAFNVLLFNRDSQIVLVLLNDAPWAFVRLLLSVSNGKSCIGLDAFVAVELILFLIKEICLIILSVLLRLIARP